MKQALIITWGYAAAVSLLNLGALWPLIVTPLALVSFTKWMSILIVPLEWAVVAATVSFFIFRNAIVVNSAFWLVFFVSAEIWRSVSMVDIGIAKHALCAEQNSFIGSLTIADEEYLFVPHAAYILADDRVMLWSYAEMAYWEAPRAAFENLDFTTCRSAVLAILEKSK